MIVSQLKIDPSAHCPNCQELTDEATGVGHEYEPRAGDVTICLYCCSVLHFVSGEFGLRLEKCPAATLLELDEGSRKQLGYAIAAAVDYKRGRA